jgi:hypothetical protein
MNRMDPRQRGLLGAAFYLGYFAHMARGGAASVTLGGGVGEFGIVHARAAYAIPYYDEAGGVYPAFHVFKGLAALKGAKLLESKADPIRNVQVVAAATDRGREVWLANLTGEATRVSVAPDMAGGQLFLLDSESFVEAARNANALAEMARDWNGGTVELGPYAVARITTP